MDKENHIKLDDISKEMVVTIRLLSSVPEEIENLLADIAKQEEQQLG